MNAATTGQQETYLSAATIARRYGFDRDAVYNWIKRGVTVAGRLVQLQARRVGKSWRVRESAWEEFMRLCNPGEHLEPARAQQEADRDARAATRELDRRLGKREAKK